MVVKVALRSLLISQSRAGLCYTALIEKLTISEARRRWIRFGGTSLSGKIHSSKRDPGTSVLNIRLTATRSKVGVNVYSPSSMDFHQAIESVWLKNTSKSLAENGKRDIPREVWT